MKNHLIVSGIVFVLLIVGLSGYNELSKPSVSDEDKFIGTWTESKIYEGSIRNITYIFSSDKLFEFNATYKDEAFISSGTWKIIDNKLIITTDINEGEIDYYFSDDDTILTIIDISGNTNVLIKE